MSIKAWQIHSEVIVSLVEKNPKDASNINGVVSIMIIKLTKTKNKLKVDKNGPINTVRKYIFAICF